MYASQRFDSVTVRTVLPHDLSVVGGQRAFAAGSPDDQVRDAGGVILRRDGDFAHTSADGACGIAHGRAEQFRQGDEGHGPRSPNKAI